MGDTNESPAVAVRACVNFLAKKSIRTHLKKSESEEERKISCDRSIYGAVKQQLKVPGISAVSNFKFDQKTDRR